MKTILFSKRNTKEILRDPINLFFALGFPLILLLLFYIINNAIPAEANNNMFNIENTAPGIATFGTAFFALFAGMLVSKDRTSSFLMRLFTSPMKATHYLLGYTLPLLLMAIIQSLITFIFAIILGLPFTINIFLAMITVIPISLLFIGIGLLCGSFLNDKAVGGICGALLTNVAGWFSGVWIPLELIGGVFKQIAVILPFYHSVEVGKLVLNGSFTSILPHIGVLLIYAFIAYGLAILIFNNKMHNGNV